MIITQADVINLLVMAILTYSLALPLRTGLLSIAPIAMAGIGGYTTALLVLREDKGLVTAITAAVVLGCLASAVLAWPLARLQGLYTSIGTLAFLIIAKAVEESAEFTGGTLGLYGIPFHDMRVPALIVLSLTIVLFFYLDHSQFGRRVDLIGHDDVLAMTVGLSPVRYRVGMQVIAGGLAAFAGATYVNSFYIMTPEIFDFYVAVGVVAFLFLGGASHWSGPLIGSVGLAGMAILLNTLQQWREVISGALLVIVLVLYPAGIGGGLRHAFRYRGYVRRRIRKGGAAAPERQVPLPESQTQAES